MTDYQNEFVFKNPENKSSLFYVITHETYLSPVQTSNGNYKGVGIQGILDLNSKDTSQIVRDYGPKASQPSATIGFNFGITAEGNVSSQGFGVGARATFGFSYNTNVESPKIVDYGIMPYSSNISFEYVDPGSWFGNFYNYNTHQSFQCILNVLEVSKDRDNISFDQQIKGRFEKYENWAFPWIDETYTISSHVERNVDEIKSLI